MFFVSSGQYFVLYSLINGYLGPGKNIAVNTLSKCAMWCVGTDGCTSFFYSIDDQLCRLTSKWYFSSDGLTSAPSFVYYMKPVDNPCERDPCNAHGTCSADTSDPPAAVCSCNHGYIGASCEHDNPCTSNTCNDHGTCAPDTSEPPAAVCSCNNGYAGNNCESGCGTAWEYKSGQCYRYVAEATSHRAAKAKCKEYGGYLAVAGTVEEHEIMGLMGKLYGKGFWIGGTDVAVEGKWKRNNGQDITMNLWNPDEPNGDENENCLEIKGSNGGLWNWNDAPCDAALPYMCEKSSG